MPYELKKVVTVNLSIDYEGYIVFGDKLTDPIGYKRPNLSIVYHCNLLFYLTF